MNLQYKKNLYASYLQLATTTLYGFIGPSIAVRIWGKDIYAVWLLLTSYLAYLYLSGAMGMDNAAYVLMGRCQGRAGKINVFRKTFLILVVSSLVFSAFTLWVSLYFPDWFMSIGEIPSSAEFVTRKVVRTLLILFLVNLPFFVSSGALVGVGMQHWKSLLDALGSLLSLLSIVFCWLAGWDLVNFAWMVASSQLLVSAIRMFLLKASLDALPANDNNDPKIGLLEVVRFGVASLGVSVAAMGIQMSEVISVGKLFPLAVVAGYLPLSRLVNMGFSVCMSMNNALAGPVSYAYNHGEDVGRIVVRFERRSMILGTGVAVGIVMFSNVFMDVWLGSGLHPGPMVSFALSGYGMLYLRTNLYNVILNACNLIKDVAWVTSFELIVKVIFIYLLYGRVGIAAVPLAGLLSSMLIPNIALPRLLPANIFENTKRVNNWSWYAIPILCVVSALGVSIVGNLALRWIMSVLLMVAVAVWAIVQWNRVNDEST